MSDSTLIEELTPGLNRYWLEDRKIVVFEPTAAYRSVIDVWVDGVIDVMAEWPLDRPYLVLHDFRAHNIVFSPYARKRSQLLVTISPRVPGYAAIVIPRSIVGYAIHWFMRTAKATNKIDNRTFFDYTEGLNWLKSNIRVLEPPPTSLEDPSKDSVPPTTPI